MAIIITRTLFLHETVTAEGEIRRRVPVFAGQRLVVQPVYDEADGFDWLAPIEGGILPLPNDAWKLDVALMN